MKGPISDSRNIFFYHIGCITIYNVYKKLFNSQVRMQDILVDTGQKLFKNVTFTKILKLTIMKTS